MGLSSSQARLLHLTARMHQIEHKAQKVQADKLRLANESDRVYNEYLEALDATKIQYKAINNDGSTTFRDANMNIMQNGIVDTYTGEKSNTILFLQDVEGKVMVTPTVAKKYGLVDSQYENRDMDTFIHETTGKNKSSEPIYGTRMVDDPTKVTGFTPITNSELKSPENNVNHNYSPVANEEGGIDYEALKGYAEFKPAHTAPPAGATEINSATDPSTIAAGTYTISTADGLQKLAQVSDLSGVNIVLTGNIDMSSISGWSGISNFKGTFDGNGYIISNLTGSQGLFASTDGATIKNVGLEDVNINGNSSFVGGLIGLSNTTNISNCYVTGNVQNNYSGTISNFTESSYVTTVVTGGLVGCSRVPGGKTAYFDNVYSSANVTASNSDGVGGLMGTAYVLYSNGVFDIKNAYAVGNITGKNGVGGFIGAMYNDEDNPSDVTDIINCYSGGSVSGSSKVGGFFGSYLYWGDRGDTSLIKNCNTTSSVNASSDEKGAFAGHLWVKIKDATSSTVGVNYLINFKDCGFKANGLEAYGTITSESGGSTAEVDGTTHSIESLVQRTDSASGLVEYNLAGSIPSIEADGSGAYMSNILGVLTMGNKFDACNHTEKTPAEIDAMKSKIRTFLNKFSNNDTDNTKLWYLNIAINEYLNSNGSQHSDLADKLYADIMNGTTTNTNSYQSGSALTGSVKRGAGSEWTPEGTHDVVKGIVEIPSRNTIADEVYYAMKMEGYTIEQSDVRNWFSRYNTSDDNDKITLANINDKIENRSGLTSLYQAIAHGDNYTNTDKYSDTDEWEIHVKGSDQTVSYTYGQKPEQYQTGTREYWDTTDPDIANAMAMWTMAKRGVIVVKEEQAQSRQYLTNMIQGGFAVFTTFEPTNVSHLTEMTEEQIMNMSDSEYEQMLGIENTSVAVNTHLREVADETDLKKAEAQYEADMNRINKKDTKYDTELAICENERNALKEEMESLKTVIKDNVDRTFKLFS